MRRMVGLTLVLVLCSYAFGEEAVVARVNEKALTSRDLEVAVDSLIPRTMFHGNVSAEKREELRERALDGLIDSELQYQDALRRGIKPERKELKKRMKNIRDRFDSKKEYRAALERAGTTEAELEARIEKDVLVDAVVRKVVTEPSAVSEDALKAYYKDNQEKFLQPEGLRIRIISSKDEKKARDALARVNSGQDFGTVAAALSEDDFRVKGGDIGYVHRGRLLPPIEQAAFSLESGKTSGLIKEGGRWYIVRAEDKTPARMLSFEESKDKLKAELEKKRAGELLETWMKELRAQAKIEILWKRGAAGAPARP